MHKGHTLVFSHANSFPAATYTQLFDIWRAAGWRVLAKDRFGHDPAYPVRSNWSPTRDELLAFIAQQGLHERVHLVGHSLGGILSFLVACRKPELVAGVVLLDSPIIGGWRAKGLQLVKATGLVNRVSPAKVSQTRRWQWPSFDAAEEHFLSKRLFQRWSPQVLRDYLACGLEPDPEHAPHGVRLSFTRDIETRFYNTLPHHFEALMRRHPLRCPVHFIGGQQSAEMRQAGMEATLKLVKGRVQMLAGGHLFPMERPAETAQAVLRALADTEHLHRPRAAVHVPGP
ncbi:MAG: alpha/beta fold hydrolase [Rubrivivax sp.]